MFPLYDTNPHHRFPWVTVAIIVVNVLAMVWLMRQPELEQAKVYAEYGFVPHRIEQLFNPNLVVDVPIAEGQQVVPVWGAPRPARKIVVRLPADRAAIFGSTLTMMFLHGGIWHLLGNMWFLWIFGNNVEDRLGHFLYACFYLVGGLLALACHWWSDPASNVPVIGASGAVAAVLGAYAITFPTAKVRTLVFFGFIFLVDIPAVIVLGFWFVMQIFETFKQIPLPVGGGVAFWAHIGGFVAGLCLMPLISAGVEPPSPSDETWLDPSKEPPGEVWPYHKR